MPTADDARLLRTAKSTEPDGLDLTVAEARALSRELFVRTFGMDRLDDVPTVGPGHLKKAPPGCGWYVRFRPAPKNPGPKDRRLDSWELVVKVPQRAEPEAGGGIAINPLRKVLVAKEPDAVRLEAIVFLARKAGRRIRASTWPVERVEALSCFDLLESYIARKLGPPPEGVKVRGPWKTRETYRLACRAFQRAFPEKEIGDLKGDWIADDYEKRTCRKPRSRFADLRTIRMALHSELAMLGAEDYSIRYANPDPGRLKKRPWTPQEYDNLLRAADGWILGPDGTPLRRRAPHSDRGAWRRAIEFLPYTASRHGRLPLVRWVPPEAEPSDGLPLPIDDRPWIEVTDDGPIYFHRDGEVPYEGNKGRAGNLVPAEFAPTVRRWFEEDIAAGIEFVFHRKGGGRYLSLHIGNWTFRQIVQDAGLGHRRIPHNFKDLAVEWADAARMRRETLAAHAATTAETLASTYGEEQRTALLQEAADAMAQGGWREKAGRRAAISARFAAGRRHAAAAPNPAASGPVASRPVARRGGRAGARGAD